MIDLAFNLKLTRMASDGLSVELNYSDGSMIIVNVYKDESIHYLNGALGNLMPMTIPRLWPFGLIAIWHECEA